MTHPDITSTQRSLEQRRAQAAWQAIERMINNSSKGKYAQAAIGATADIQINGLGQALAFWLAKGDDHYRLLANDVSTWVRSQISFQEGDLLSWIVNTANTEQYRRATSEALAYLGWLKRFAKAKLA